MYATAQRNVLAQGRAAVSDTIKLSGNSLALLLTKSTPERARMAEETTTSGTVTVGKRLDNPQPSATLTHDDDDARV
jgi:hypothetical protein